MTLKSRLARAAIALCLLAVTLDSLPAVAEGPTDQIKSAVDRALLVLADPRLKLAAKSKERRDQLKQILFTRFDFAEMAKRALGSNWRRRTAQEQEEFVRLFTDLLERAYAQTIEAYTNEKIVYVGERLDGNFADVNSKIVTRKGEEFSIGYKAHLAGSEWKVYDVVVENISMVNNFRAQFQRVLANSSYEELLRRLKDKQADFAARKN